MSFILKEGKTTYIFTSSTYPYVIAPNLHVAHGVPVVWRAPGEAAVLAYGHLFHVAVVESVFVVLGAAPGLHILGLH